MNEEEKEAPIAHREFYLMGTDKRYRLEIFAPRQSSDEFKSWSCRVQIHGEDVPEGLDSIKSGGNDSLQALMLAFKIAKVNIEVLNRRLGSNLRLFTDADPNLRLD